MTNTTQWCLLFFGVVAGLTASACCGEPSPGIMQESNGSNLTFDLGRYHFTVPKSEIDYVGLNENPPGVSFDFLLPNFSAARLIGKNDWKTALQHTIFVTIEDSDMGSHLNVLRRIVQSYTADGEVAAIVGGFDCKNYTRGKGNLATHWIGCAPTQKPEHELILCTNDDLPIPRCRARFAFRELGVSVDFPRSYVSQWQTVKAGVSAKLSSYIDDSPVN